jgi:hypothetical protein
VYDGMSKYVSIDEFKLISKTSVVMNCTVTIKKQIGCGV